MLIVGCRPNFMKASPLLEELKRDGTFEAVLVHTGQHYDYEMSKIFFDDLEMPKPDYHLKEIGELKEVIETEKPDFVVVFGDVNSTADSAVIASRMGVPVVHIEAGLRSFNKKMLEENNRIITDHISDLLFVTELVGLTNLNNEGISEKKVELVGNLMIDTLIKYKDKAMNRKKKEGNYCALTLHRAENVDNKRTLTSLLETIKEIQEDIVIVWPLHPRTKKRMELFGLDVKEMKNVVIVKPLGYLDMINLIMNSQFVITDSGGIQEETSYLDIPCITLRNETERPSTIEYGTSILVGTDRKKILEAIRTTPKQSMPSRFWDGKTAERIVKRLKYEY